MALSVDYVIYICEPDHVSFNRQTFWTQKYQLTLWLKQHNLFPDFFEQSRFIISPGVTVIYGWLGQNVGEKETLQQISVASGVKYQHEGQSDDTASSCWHFDSGTYV